MCTPLVRGEYVERDRSSFRVLWCGREGGASCFSENNGNESIQEKIDSELAYLDTKLIEMLNKANGISLENYIVKAEKINEQASNNDKNSQSHTDAYKDGQGDEWVSHNFS